MAELILGIDIGGTNTKFGLVDKEGNISNEGTFSTEADKDISVFLELLKSNVSELLDNNDNIIGIGVGAPNANFYKGTIEYPANLNWGEVIPFADLLKQTLGLPAVLTNDANAAAMGEMLFGAAKGMKNFVVVTLGTGLGSGIVVNGELVYGNTGFAGEMGHMMVRIGGRKCGCGAYGHLEAYVSATGIKRTAFKMMAKGTLPSKLREVSFDKFTAKMISEAADAGDQLALDTFDYTAQILGQALADVMLITSPEAIFLFGGLVKSGHHLLGPTKTYMEESCMKMFKWKTDLRPSALMDKNAAVLGAAALGWKEFGEN